MEQARILVVDDDQIIRDSLCEFLRLEGYKSEGAGSFTEALKELEKQRYNLAITDVNMPEIDGFELLRVIQKRYPEIVTIIITGYRITHKQQEFRFWFKLMKSISDHVANKCEVWIIGNLNYLYRKSTLTFPFNPGLKVVNIYRWSCDQVTA